MTAALSVACDGGADGDTADAGTCDPVAQTGCPAGRKCTWIRAAASPAQQLGALGCAPAGDAGLEEDCRYGAAGAAGHDDCAAGLICLADPSVERARGTCRAICDLDARGGAAGACAAAYACGHYASFFQNRADTPVAGVCDPTCDPLTQVRDVDGAAACGSPVPGAPTLGCYDAAPTPNPVAARPPSFSCAVVAGAVGHRGEAVDDRGEAYTNVCAPGHIMGFYDSDDPATQKVVCLKLCKPGDTHRDAPDSAHGVGDFQCRGDGFTDGDECRYWWFFDGSTFSPSFGPNALSNELGICWRHTDWHFDSDGDAVADKVWPSCRALSAVDDPGPEPQDRAGEPDTTAENLEWGCGPLPRMRARVRAVRPPITIPESSRAQVLRALRARDRR